VVKSENRILGLENKAEELEHSGKDKWNY
jgi:hypothetical protein